MDHQQRVVCWMHFRMNGKKRWKEKEILFVIFSSYQCNGLFNESKGAWLLFCNVYIIHLSEILTKK